MNCICEADFVSGRYLEVNGLMILVYMDSLVGCNVVGGINDNISCLEFRFELLRLYRAGE